MRKSLGFTLAEVLITLAIIGVVAAMTIPSVIVRTNQQEFKSGFKKAVSVLNQAVTMNIAIDNDSPADAVKAADLFNFMTRRLNVIKTTEKLNGSDNMAFYTADGFRFEIPTGDTTIKGTKFQSKACGDPNPKAGASTDSQGNVTNIPCLIVVDVNGDKTPNPPVANTYSGYKVPAATSTRILDVFTLMITDVGVVPWGTVAQRTMFQAD